MKPELLGQRCIIARAGSTPLTMPAHHAFTLEELEERIRVYAARAAAGVPITGAGAPRESTGKNSVVCMCCAAVVPGGKTARALRWRFRLLPGRNRKKEFEIYCPACFAKWGWGDEPVSAGAGREAGV